MKMQTLERALLLASVLFALAAVARWRGSDPAASAPSTIALSTRSRAELVSDSALAEAEGLTVHNDPFRLSNTPPDVRYDPAGEAAQLARGGAAVPPPLRPTFALRAIVGGPPWHAVIDGIPGQPSGTVTRQGAQFDRILVRSVSRDSVILQGPDTSWVLRFGKQP